MGALRIDELTNITIDDIIDYGNLFLAKIPKTKTKISKSFTIQNSYYGIVKHYFSLRPSKVNHRRAFLNYQRGKCTVQAIGKNKFALMPKQIAIFLNLENPELYTGHSFRRSSTTLLADADVDITTIKQHSCWKSNKSAESYIAESLSNKRKIANLITSSINSKKYRITTG